MSTQYAWSRHPKFNWLLMLADDSRAVVSCNKSKKGYLAQYHGEHDHRDSITKAMAWVEYRRKLRDMREERWNARGGFP